MKKISASRRKQKEVIRGGGKLRGREGEGGGKRGEGGGKIGEGGGKRGGG